MTYVSCLLATRQSRQTAPVIYQLEDKFALADAAASVRAQTAAKVAIAEAEALANLADASRATRRGAEAVEVPEVSAPRPHPPAGPLPTSKRQKTEDTKKR